MNTEQSQLTAAEMGKLWATYVGNTMGKCVLSYYDKHVNDKEIKKLLQYALILCEKYIQDIKVIFNKSNFPIPVGFTDDDVNLEAPRLYEDSFYLRYLAYLSKAGMSIYHVAIPLVTRKDIRDFFAECLQDTLKLSSMVGKRHGHRLLTNRSGVVRLTRSRGNLFIKKCNNEFSSHTSPKRSRVHYKSKFLMRVLGRQETAAWIRNCSPLRKY